MKDKYRFLPAILMVVLSSLATAGPAANGPAPSAITAPEVKQLMENGDALLVNVLSNLEHRLQHIPGSINIPIDEVTNAEALPQDKGRVLIFYCMGKR